MDKENQDNKINEGKQLIRSESSLKEIVKSKGKEQIELRKSIDASKSIKDRRESCG
jgi:hypothetical protein